MSERPQATTIVQPWMPGMPKPEGMTVLDAVEGYLDHVDHVEAELEDEATDPRFHDECGYAWPAHDRTTLSNQLPFGCPSEAYARLTWGDR